MTINMEGHRARLDALSLFIDHPHCVASIHWIAKGLSNMIPNVYSRPTLKVVLPASMSDFFAKAEYKDSLPSDQRRTRRLQIRCRAAMTIESSPPGVYHADRETEVLIQDISRSGINFLWHEPLVRDEIVFLRFHARQIRAVVVRHRELGPNCFECGTRMLSFVNLADFQDLATKNLASANGEIV